MSCILILLDVSAAFDTVDHDFLLQKLNHVAGFQGSVLEWFTSYLKERTFSVNVEECFSSCAQISYGVPQGSILGTLLFALYMLPLGHIIKRHNLSYNFCADDTLLYLPVKDNSLFDCLHDKKCWMDVNFLQLNNDKNNHLWPISSDL